VVSIDVTTTTPPIKTRAVIANISSLRIGVSSETQHPFAHAMTGVVSIDVMAAMPPIKARAVRAEISSLRIEVSTECSAATAVARDDRGGLDRRDSGTASDQGESENQRLGHGMPLASGGARDHGRGLDRCDGGDAANQGKGGEGEHKQPGHTRLSSATTAASDDRGGLDRRDSGDATDQG
jgi:hypothetical protein